MRNKTHTDNRHTTEKLRLGGMHVPDGKCDCLPEPESLFYRSLQGKDSSKNQALRILDAR
jgi:hypothetical protein